VAGVDQPTRVISERTISLDCAQCGDPITLAHTGRRPRYCSDTCRKRASEERRAAARLGYPQPVTRVVREVVERVTTLATPPRPPAPPSSAPRTGTEWAAELRGLADRMRTRPLSLVRSRDEFHDLADAVAELHAALQPGARHHPQETRRRRSRRESPRPRPAPVCPASSGAPWNGSSGNGLADSSARNEDQNFALRYLWRYRM
jgi:hypothetical protein